MNQAYEGCGSRCGRLPDCAPLALGVIPVQSSSPPRYEPGKALARGTLFPGLDLPLQNIVNTGTADVPAAELMALDFAAHDLALYLDTHPEDTEAFSVYRECLRLAELGRRRYTERYGPLMLTDLADAESFRWLDRPFPWAKEE